MLKRPNLKKIKYALLPTFQKFKKVCTPRKESNEEEEEEYGLRKARTQGKKLCFEKIQRILEFEGGKKISVKIISQPAQNCNSFFVVKNKFKYPTKFDNESDR